MNDFVMVPRELVQSAICYIDSKDEREGDFIAGPLERALAAAPLVAAEPVADPFMGHEALHTAHLARDFVHNNLIEHSFVAEDPALLHFAEKAADALRDLYQGIAEKTLYTHPKEPVNRQLVSALNAMLTQFGMDEDEWSKPVFDRARAALQAALAALPREGT